MTSPKPISRTISGKKYQYYDVGKGSPTVVLLHGIARNKDLSLSKMEKYDLDTRFIVPDLPGHLGVPFDGIESIEDTVMYVRDLIEELELDSAVIVGYSLGGLIALKCGEILSDKDWMKGVVAWASPILGHEGISREGQALISRVLSMKERTYNFVTRPIVLKFSSLVGRVELTELEIDGISKYPMESFRRQVRMIEEAKYNRNTGVETLLVYGVPDRLVSENNYSFAVEEGGEKTKVIKVENGGHFGTEEGIGRSCKEIGNFIKEIGKKEKKG